MSDSRETRARARVPFVHAFWELQEREKRFLVAEILKTRGLMPVLMKPRNGERWSLADRAEIAAHVRRLSRLSPYLLVLVMPGGLVLLPAMAWWLDRRRNRRPGDAAAA